MREEMDAYLELLAGGEIPGFLLKYAAAPQMQRLKGVGLFCGTDYSRLYKHRYFFSRYDHSLGVALIVWRFTKDRAQAISGLLHDIATPVFSHSVDFMNGDALTQESTEENTEGIIKGSAHIMALLRLNQIPLSAVSDYHLYPIADNDSPRLSADRLEYSFSTMLIWHGAWRLHDIAQMYGDLCIQINEDGAKELAFQSLAMAEKFVRGSLQIGKGFQENTNKLSLNLLGDILRMAVQRGIVSQEQLHTLTEPALIQTLENTGDAALRNAWRRYSGLSQVYGANEAPKDRYFVRVDAKRRYIDPLVQTSGRAVRASAASPSIAAAISEFRRYEDLPYGYVDFALERS